MLGVSRLSRRVDSANKVREETNEVIGNKTNSIQVQQEVAFKIQDREIVVVGSKDQINSMCSR
jgi:hypothetical protein